MRPIDDNGENSFVTIAPDKFCEWNLSFLHQAGLRRAFL